MALPVILIGVGVGAALASSALRKRDTTVVKDDKQSTTATRGDFLPLVNGRDFVGPKVLWVGESFTKMEAVSGGGKGLKRGQKQRIYYEKAWHGLCAGPAYRLHRIRQGGEVVFEGPIDSESHPSGSVIDCGMAGFFVIYWGETDQPVNTFLGSIDRRPEIGVTSGWPFACYVVWLEKRLGLAKQWPLMDYEIECLPYGSTLVRTPSFQGPSASLNGMPRPVFSATNGGPGKAQLGSIVIDGGDYRREFPPGGRLRLTGNAAGDADHKIFSTSFVKVPGIGGTERTTITLADDLVGANNQGTVEGYVFNEDDGVNPIHALDSILRESFPHGLGGIAGAVDDIDVASMEAGAQLLATEGIVGHVTAKEGETALSVLSKILIDAGAVISLEHTSGRWRLVMIRKPVPSIPFIPADAICNPVPEIENNLGPKRVDRPIFTFLDREKNFRTNEVSRPSDSQAIRQGHSRPRQIAMEIPIKYAVAEKVAERRSLETNAHGNKFELSMNRATRLLMPGRAFVASGISQVLRVLEKKIDPLTSVVKVVATTDAYGVRSQTFFPDPETPEGEDFPDPVADPESVVLEVDPPLNRSDEPVVSVLRIRDNNRIRGASVWISEDGISFVHAGFFDFAHAGGRLLEGLGASGDSMLEAGPSFMPLGPDLSLVQDFSLDLPNWHRGRQLCVFGNGEICCLRNITPIGGGAYRLMGLIRGRGPTGMLGHVVGEAVYILDPRNILPIRDVAMEPGATVYFKVQPFTLESQSVPLSEIPAQAVTIRGYGVAPMKPAHLRTTNNRNAYQVGATIPFTWQWRSPLGRRSGAGEQGYGRPYTAAAPLGSFTLRFRDVFLGTVRGEVGGILRPPFNYTQDALVAHFGGQPSSFIAELTNVANGFESAVVSALVTQE